ncbi:group 1 truncated hemoglobin [Hydrogenophaga sp. PAMC20947]|uniref:group I truncated hemoglobin n=1 Tax=Hydrogenophaga sp. PAMC20947 TaxID=2565558 RepID=UPI00109DC063|nr:group 1 truncated hemoglobin [Hydrogenophaga sp. PAMC20947]QCB45375.1 group 1 truncated hemoglobin [Hydrogenophaga sp. PAMC20947]
MSETTTSTASTLYDRLGRREGIARISHELIKNHLANPLVQTRFGQIKDMDQTERNVIDFFCAGSGGPNNYAGKDMLNTHRGMNISEQEFVSVIDDAIAALTTCGVEPPVRNEVLGVLWSMKAEVVRV